MKNLSILVALVIFLCCTPTPASAKYCKVNDEGKATSCLYKTKRTPDNAQIVISYTQQGWSMMIAIFLDEFSMIEGNARAKAKKGEEHTLEFVNIRRDMLYTGRVMEAPVYLVSEEMLHEFSNAKGKVRFWLNALDTKDVEVEVAAGLLSGVDDYIAETKSLLGELFEDDEAVQNSSR